MPGKTETPVWLAGTTTLSPTALSSVTAIFHFEGRPEHGASMTKSEKVAKAELTPAVLPASRPGLTV